VILAQLSCQPEEHTTSPILQLVDSVRLQESDSQFIGLPGGFAVSADGAYFIGDLQQRTVHRYASDGTRLGGIGRPGEGPGEFRAPPAVLATEGDSLFVVLGPELQVFDSRTGVLLATRSLPGTFFHSIAVDDGRVFFRYLNPEARSTVGVLTLASDSIETGGPFPELLGRSPVIASPALSQVIATPAGGDTILVAVQSSNFVYVGPIAGPFDSVPVAVVGRQGARPDLLEQIAADPENAGTAVYTPSLPTALQRLSSGELLHVVSDLQLVESRFSGKLLVSVIDLSGRTTCPDAEVPVPADPRPLSVIHGDTLVVLSQQVSGTESQVWVRKYLVDATRCEWVRS
jgi:hypothetical protein